MKLLNVNQEKLMVTKKSIISLSCLVVLILILSACKKQTKECISYNTAQVTKVIGPDTVLVNQETVFTVNYILQDGCGQFEDLESNSNGHTVTINLMAKYQGCICPDILLGGETTYKFKPTQTGIFYLKFVQPNKTHFIDTVTVN